MSLKKHVLEPELSQNIKDILARSEGEKEANKQVMDIHRIKYQVMKMLTSNEDLLMTIHHPTLSNKESLNGDSFIGEAIFDYWSLPPLKEQAKNYVCYEVDAYTDQSTGIDTIRLGFRCVAHEDDVSTDYAINRHDLLALIINEEYDWTNVFGKQLRKISDIGYATTDKYYYREIIYSLTVPYNNFNRLNK